MRHLCMACLCDMCGNHEPWTRDALGGTREQTKEESLTALGQAEQAGHDAVADVSTVCGLRV